MRPTRLALLLASICAPAVRAKYSLQTDYSGAQFFEGFDFFTDPDPTGGTVLFVNEAEANDTGLAGFLDMGNSQTAIYMAADSTSEITEGTGRPSVRLSSNQTYNHGLFIVDIQHMPTGCGTWPAFWLVGPDWPVGGEIDIVEGVNVDTQNGMTLHTSPAFDIATTNFTGYLTQGTDCNLGTLGNGEPNMGCSIQDSSNMTFGNAFNDNQGAVFATEWTSDFIKIWSFPRGSTPADVNSSSPDPTGWGEPSALFANNGTSTIDQHFANMSIIFDLTLCGDWAGAVWNTSECSTLAPTCEEYVMNTPSAFTEAYWAVNSLQVFQDS